MDIFDVPSFLPGKQNSFFFHPCTHQPLILFVCFFPSSCSPLFPEENRPNNNRDSLELFSHLHDSSGKGDRLVFSGFVNQPLFLDADVIDDISLDHLNRDPLSPPKVRCDRRYSSRSFVFHSTLLYSIGTRPFLHI